MKRLLLILAIATLGCGLINSPTVTPTSPGAPPPPITDTASPPTASPTIPPPTDTATPPAPSGFPNPDNYTWSLVAGNLTRPVDVQHAGDGSGRLFVVEQPGRIRIVENGQLLETPFLDITDRVNDGGNEQGLLGLAFHPNYEQNGFFYVNYTRGGGDTVIARFQVTGNPNLADPNSSTQLLEIEQPFPNHNGGVLAFGPDGYLYIGSGDGGSAGDPFGNGQSLNTLLGKVLRIDVDNGDPYAIPPDNPFGNEIWAYGLRNPWRMSFDSATGDLWIGDVGQGTWEEIDLYPFGAPGGLNFGWVIFEGSHPYGGSNATGLTMPVSEYNHTEGGCSVTGGYVYRGAMSEWQGIYLYGDYCTGFIWGLIPFGDGWQAQRLYASGLSISSFGVDETNELYVADLGGAVYRLTQR